MISSIFVDPLILTFVLALLLVLFVALVLRRLNQPFIVAYLLSGFLIGPHMLGLIQDQEALTRAGSFGVVFLLFFIGMEISPRKLTENWPVSIIGTLLQIGISLFFVSLLGISFSWSIKQIILFGFVISLSSTAVTLKLLEEWREIETRVGQNVLGILLVQDILIIPMFITLNLLGGDQPSFQEVLLQVIGGLIVIALVVTMIIKDHINLPWLEYLKKDHELQLFASLAICLGAALFTGFMGLSTALGSFVGGMIIRSAKETHWVQQKLHSIRTIFIAFFFISIGMLINIHFLYENIWQISFLVGLAFLTNTFINAIILKFLRESWENALYGGSLLSQIGEFSFVIAAVGYNANIIKYFAYEVTVSVIVLTLILSPLWILSMRKLIKLMISCK